MIDFNIFKKQCAVIDLCEHSINIRFKDKKIVLLAKNSYDYDIYAEPLGIREYMSPTDNDDYADHSRTGTGVFEDGRQYIIKDIEADNILISRSNRLYCKKITLELYTMSGTPCSLIFASDKIYIDIIDTGIAPVLRPIIGENVRLCLSDSILTIDKDKTRWMFSSNKSNYKVELYSGTMDEEHWFVEYSSIPIQEEMLGIYIDCRVLKLEYNDDMLGTTDIPFNLYFTNLYCEFMTENGKAYAINIDTDKMEIVRFTFEQD